MLFLDELPEFDRDVLEANHAILRNNMGAWERMEVERIDPEPTST